MPATRSTSFERSLDQFRRELSDDQKKDFSGANQKYINSMLQDMQNRLGREKGLCRLTRIEKFLDAMKHIEDLVTIFLNVSEVVAFVWGPIKLALMVATTWTDSVRQLLDAYEEIGEVLGNLAFFHELIKSSEYHREIVEYYFSDILHFHRCVLNVFSRPDLKTYFKLSWGSFRHKIKPIIESLKRRQDILSDDKLQSHAIFKEVQDSSSYAKDQFKSLQSGLEDIRTAFENDQLRSKASQNREMKAFLEGKLSVPEFRADRQLASSEQSAKSSGSWIFSHPTFRSWENEKSHEGNVLFLNGSPGAGKSLAYY
ncbi:hypothetical protein FSARC_3014 [Fusarium sarcochroum]|uniref:Fungal STAND N-terminal Goodbye domain-containing protein n=1 Tax=Fusarium sarcochroum TaxID=1208366 RepID=A0A8H4XD56_9HYPO|nr:hypothetical protein FSARC_3014 [Fusarium sarcochroum]